MDKFTTTIKYFGFWQENDPPMPCESIFVYLNSDSVLPDKEKYLHYLEDIENWLMVGLSGDKCLLNEEHIFSFEVVTDGVWVWPSSLPHYVRFHNLHLCKEFAEHIRRNNFQIPYLSEEDRIPILQKYRKDFSRKL